MCAAAPLSALLLLWMGALVALDGLILLFSPWCGRSFCWEEASATSRDDLNKVESNVTAAK